MTKLGSVRARLWVRLLACSLVLGGFLHACGGAEFGSGSQTQQVDGDAGMQGNAGSAAGGQGGSEIGACQGPEECDDEDPCTVDVCKANGSCDHAPTCATTEQCCEGRCGECCADTDCDDGIGCTVDRCFLGACIAVADDGACANTLVEMYCSLMGDCRAREPCAGDAPLQCEDGDNCTVDSCAGGLCAHDSCAQGSLCCPEFGCSTCCSDSQCDDGDPCTVDQCDGGGCSHTSLCPDGDQCCPHPDGSSASCGQCCNREGCDDGVGCTVDSCVQGQCSSVPDANLCPPGDVCTAGGCDAPQDCEGPSDCTSDNPCLTGSCQGGICEFSGCDADELCCTEGCNQCCGNPDCDDGDLCTDDTCEGGDCAHLAVNCPLCDPMLGCVECEDAADCDDGVDCTIDTCTSNKVCDHTGGGCGTSRCCGTSCQECCSSNDCIGAVDPGGVDPPQVIGAPCAACVDGKCDAIVYCDDTQHCCNGACIPGYQLCSPTL